MSRDFFAINFISNYSLTESDYHDFEKILEIVGLQEDLVLLSPLEQTTSKIYYNVLISDAITSINCDWRIFI